MSFVCGAVYRFLNYGIYYVELIRLMVACGQSQGLHTILLLLIYCVSFPPVDIDDGPIYVLARRPAHSCV